MPPADRAGSPEKDPAAFRTIREVSEQLGVPQHVLRFWETRFPELKPLQRGGNRRYYRPADVAFAAALHKLLHQDGYTVKGVRKLITDNGAGNLVAIANGDAVAPRGRSAPVAVAAVPVAAPAPEARPVAVLQPAGLSAGVVAASRALLDDLLRLREGLAAALAV
jgi:DNA-binding transcriptional MerR regulator